MIIYRLVVFALRLRHRQPPDSAHPALLFRMRALLSLVDSPRIRTAFLQASRVRAVELPATNVPVRKLMGKKGAAIQQVNNRCVNINDVVDLLVLQSFVHDSLTMSLVLDFCASD